MYCKEVFKLYLCMFFFSSIYSNPTGITQCLSSEFLPASHLSINSYLCAGVFHSGCSSWASKMTFCLLKPHPHKGTAPGLKCTPLWSCKAVTQVIRIERNGVWSRERHTKGRKKTRCANFVHEVKREMNHSQTVDI